MWPIFLYFAFNMCCRNQMTNVGRNMLPKYKLIIIQGIHKRMVQFQT
jgi:hypothetical protein